MGRKVVFHKVLDLLTFPCWMEYEQKPFIFQDEVSALLIDNGKAAELGIWVSFFQTCDVLIFLANQETKL